MLRDDPRLSIERVDDAEVFIPSFDAWEELRSDPVIDGLPVAVLELLWDLLSFVRHYPDHFALALYCPHLNYATLLTIVLLRTSTGWQRVHIEYLTCGTCGWHGGTAYPMLSELYFGVPDSREALDRAWHRPVLPCPGCGAALPRRPIWIEPTAVANTP